MAAVGSGLGGQKVADARFLPLLLHNSFVG